MKDKICCIFNIGPHYRSAIYRQMAENLDCDFYFGDRLKQKIELVLQLKVLLMLDILD
jgi:hypothetical protein